MTAYLGRGLGHTIVGTTSTYSGTGNVMVEVSPSLTDAQKKWVDKWIGYMQGTNIYSSSDLVSLAHGGGAFVITQNNQLLARFALGTANPEANLRWTWDTVGPIRSVTKFLTAYVLAKVAADNGVGATPLIRFNEFMDRPMGSFSIISNNIEGRSSHTHPTPDGIIDRTDVGLQNRNRPAYDYAHVTVRQQVAHTNAVGQFTPITHPMDANGVTFMGDNLNRPIQSMAELVQHYDRISGHWEGFDGTIDLPYAPGYDDKNGMLLAAVIEEVTGNTWVEEVNTMLSALGVSRMYPQLGGSYRASGFPIGSQGFTANPIQIHNRAKLVEQQENGGVITIYDEITVDPDTLVGFASGWGSATSLAEFGWGVHTTDYIPQEIVDEVFSAQTETPDNPAAYAWTGVNWGIGAQKLLAIGGSECWGSVGQGGFGGGGGSYCYVNDSHMVFAGAGNGLAYTDSSLPGVHPNANNGSSHVWSMADDWYNNFGS